MKRLTIDPRPNWTKEVEALGFDFYLMEGIPYWTERAYYAFTAAEIDRIEEAANRLHKLCMYAVERVVTEKLYPILGISPEIGTRITKSWSEHEPAVYGRFDLMYDGVSAPKMLEYNADTPISLFEASIVQWNWREQRFPNSDQFNSIQEALQERWRQLLVGRYEADRLYITTSTPMPEDEATVQYIGQCAKEAGYNVTFIPIQHIGWDEGSKSFVSMDNQPIRRIFKLYPWEWLMKDVFGWNIDRSQCQWLEPAWKMVLSNKGILPILWEMFPEHENLLPAYFTPRKLAGMPMVRKPLLGRGGANIDIRSGDGQLIASSDGQYGSTGYIYQAYAPPPTFDGNRANLGVWMVNDAACGMGIREDDGLIISNSSRFVPHVFDLTDGSIPL